MMRIQATQAKLTVQQYSVQEISVTSESGFDEWNAIDMAAEFVRPDGSRVKAEAFYDGGDTCRIRAYCGHNGEWSWRLHSGCAEWESMGGAFEVIPSDLPGKLRLHPEDPRQFQYDNGQPFLHIGDTGYRYVADMEPYWREYLEQADAAGFTKIRVWFCKGRSDVGALFLPDRTGLNLDYWQEMDRRIRYALRQFPALQLQLIPFGEDAEEVIRCGEGDPISRLALRTAIARFSALPNVQWCISNDLTLEGTAVAEREEGQRSDWAGRLRASIQAIGTEVARMEPWGTLLTNHQSRFTGYSFVHEDWSDIITLEDLGQVTGDLIRKYRELGRKPVVLDEDRYEHWKAPAHKRYYFRRLVWGCLLSGGHATYGGLHTYRPFDGDKDGMYGYFDACRDEKLEQGAHDFVFIRQFFRESGFTLAGAVPCDGWTGNIPLLYKSMRSGDGGMTLVYLANPTVYKGHAPDGFSGTYTDEAADTGRDPPTVVLRMEGAGMTAYRIRWFNPRNGYWTDGGTAMVTGPTEFTAPDGGDWILLLSREND